jgi:hypothetical protein
MSSFLFDLISKAKQLDIEGNYVEADRVYENLKKIANTKNHFDSRVVISQSNINTIERPNWIVPTGTRYIAQGTELLIQDKLLNQDPDKAKHQSLVRVNAIINSFSRILDLKIGYIDGSGNVFGHGFDLSSTVTKTNLENARKEYRKCKELLDKVQIGEYVNKKNVIDKDAENMINDNIDNQSEYASTLMTLGTSIRNLLRGISEGDVQDALKQLTHSEVALQKSIQPNLKTPEVYEVAKASDKANYGRTSVPGTESTPTSYKEPSSWKEKRMPDAAPDIFGATVKGSKAAINSGFDKLNNADDSQFVNIYQGEIETIENAFIANEGKLTGQEKAKYQREMKSLEDRYYTILYKDKEKPFVD